MEGLAAINSIESKKHAQNLSFFAAVGLGLNWLRKRKMAVIPAP